jgi:hypothetical protein
MTENESQQQESGRTGQPLGERIYCVAMRGEPRTRWGSTLLEIARALDDCERTINESKCRLLKVQQEWFPVNNLKPSKEALDKLKQEFMPLEKNSQYVKNCLDFYTGTKSLRDKANRALRKLS